MPESPTFTTLQAVFRTAAGDRWWEFKVVGRGKRGERVGEYSLLDRVVTAAEERHLSQNTLITWLKLIAWAGAEGLPIKTLSEDRAGEFYEEATRGRSASHHLQAKAASRCSITS